jgi:single-stranded-DNA-specific exonuclease
MIAGKTERPFLGVEKSVLDQVWRDRLDLPGRNRALAMAQTTDLPEIICRVLAGRGVNGEIAAAFLEPAIRDLMPDPSVLTDLELAADRIVRAIDKHEKVAIFGDYDVDGAASSALLYRFLLHHDIHAEIYIPDRIFEGYGPNPAAIEDLAGRGAKLIVTVDCGSTSFEAFEHAAKLGVDIVALDHHQVDTELPPAVAIVNPNRQDDMSGLDYLCAAGVVFMTLVAVARRLRNSGKYQRRKEAPLLQQLDLVALATVCDVVPLTGLNRAFVKRGLEMLHARKNCGLAALAQSARLSGPPSVYHLGFLLGPRINAGGRIGDAALGSRLLVSDDPGEAREIAEKLEALNRERQIRETAMLEQAMAEAEAEIAGGEGPSVLVVCSDQWHAGIVGLIAARLKEVYRRPVFAINFDGRGIGSGSGRSIGNADIGGAVRAAMAQGLLIKGGGHRMAAGVTVERGKLGELRTFLEHNLASAVRKQQQDHSLEIDGALTARSANIALCELLESAGPYGSGHPSPIFAFPGHGMRNPRIVGQGHISLRISAGDGAPMQAIAFRAADTALGEVLLRGPERLHVAGAISADYWQGQRRVQLRIIDAAIPDNRLR